jgi:hypothetical protein
VVARFTPLQDCDAESKNPDDIYWHIRGLVAGVGAGKQVAIPDFVTWCHRNPRSSRVFVFYFSDNPTGKCNYFLFARQNEADISRRATEWRDWRLTTLASGKIYLNFKIVRRMGDEKCLYGKSYWLILQKQNSSKLPLAN